MPPSWIARLRGLRQSHAGAAAFAEDALVGDFVVLRFAAQILGRDLLQLLLGVHRDRMRRARHRVRGLAATGDAGPRQILRRVSPGDFALFPRHAQDLGGHAVDIDAPIPCPDCRCRIECRVLPSGLITNSPSKPIDPPEQALARNANTRAPSVPLRLGWAFRSSHWNCSAPRSSASLMNALVDMRRLPVCSRAAQPAPCLRER